MNKCQSDDWSEFFQGKPKNTGLQRTKHLQCAFDGKAALAIQRCFIDHLEARLVAMEICIQLDGLMNELAVLWDHRSMQLRKQIFVNEWLDMHSSLSFLLVQTLDDTQYGFEEFASAKRSLHCCALITSSSTLVAELQHAARKSLLLHFGGLLVQYAFQKDGKTNLWIALPFGKSLRQSFQIAYLNGFEIVLNCHQRLLDIIWILHK